MTALLADPAFPRLKERLIRATGLAYYADKDAELAHRLAERLAACGCPDCDSYLALLTSFPEGETELDRAIGGLTNGETFFFRHRELFDALRDVTLPDVIARNRPARRLRVWSAGCSVGAEPYSLAILIRRAFTELADWDVRILGTDVNREFLARARSGRFEPWALRGLPDDVRRDCFTRAGAGWAIRPEFAAGVSFRYHNLVVHEFPSPHDLADFDLILCRNVTIYFSPDIVRRLVERFHRALADGGWLAVGHAEPNVDVYRAFRTINAPGAVLYQKAAPAPREVAWAAPVAPVLPPAPVTPVEPEWAEPVTPPPPPNVVPTLDDIRALADRGAWTDAARACDRLLAADGLNAAAHYYHGLVLEHAREPAGAEAALRRAIYLDRGHVLAHYHLARLLQRSGRPVEAARGFRNALELLAGRAPGEQFEGDEITAGELAKLVAMHLETTRGGDA